MPSKTDINPSTGQPYAVNPATGVWDDNYWANTVEPQLKAQYGFSSGGGGGGGAAPAPQIDPIETARKLRQFTLEANQPYISSLQTRIPEIQQRFAAQRTQIETEKEPLKQRYQNLLSELRRRESVELEQTGTTKSREFGRRGIPLSSGLFDVELQEAQRPTRELFTGQTKDVGLEQEEGLRQLANLQTGLGGEETEQLGGVQNLIGQLQVGEPVSAIQQALQILGLRQQQAEAAASRGLQERQFALSERELGLRQQVANQPNTQIVNVGGRTKLVNTQTGAIIQDLGPWGSPSGPTQKATTMQLKNSLVSQAARGATLNQLTQQFGGGLPLNDIVKFYTAVSPHGPPKEDWAKEILGINKSGNKSGIVNPY